MTAPLSILDVISEVFADWFRDRASWAPWFGYLAVLFGLPLTPDQLALFQQCTGRRAPLAGGYTEAWLICGRRAGKSFVLALIAVFLACFRDWGPYLVPGETGRIAIIAADRRQARVIFGYVLGFLQNTPMLAGLIVRQTMGSVDLSNGVSIEIQACSFRTIRGYSMVACLADESSFWVTDETGANPDTEVIRSIRPALASIRGSMLLVASSPYAERGALWAAYRKHHGKDSPVLTWQAPTRVMNPSIPQSVIDEAMETDPASAIAEYGAQFRSDVAALVERAIIDRAVDRGIAARPPIPGLTYTCFMDAASGVGGHDGDRFAAAWAHKEGDTIVVDHVYVMRPPFDAAQAFAEVAGICRNYGVTEVCSDRYSIGFVVSECGRHGLTHQPSELDKSRLYLGSLSQFTSNRVRLPDVPQIVDEYCLLERRPGSDGRDKVDARGGRHEDLANVVSGAIMLLSKPRSSADGWCEALLHHSMRYRTDVDDVRAASGPAPGWGYSLGNKTAQPVKLVKVVVPEPIASTGAVQLSHRTYTCRYSGGEATAEMQRADAAHVLQNQVWASLNPHLVREMVEKVARPRDPCPAAG